MVRCIDFLQGEEGIFTPKKANTSDRNVDKIANSQKLLPREPPFLMSEPAEKPPLHLALVVVSTTVIVGLLPHLQDKQAVGIGSGSTIVFAVERIGR